MAKAAYSIQRFGHRRGPVFLVHAMDREELCRQSNGSVPIWGGSTVATVR
jgi:hypothetical protein